MFGLISNFARNFAKQIILDISDTKDVFCVMKSGRRNGNKKKETLCKAMKTTSKNIFFELLKLDFFTVF